LLLLVLALSAQASPEARVSPSAESAALVQGGQVNIKRPSAEERATAYSTWTREAMLAAQPLEVAVVAEEAALPPLTAEAIEIDMAAMKIIAPGAPAADATQLAQEAYAEDWAMLEDAAADYVLDSLAAGDQDGTLAPTGTSGVYDSYELNRFPQFHTGFPYRTIGQFFFQNAAGSRFACTASTMGGRNIIATAAHCLFETGTNQWYRNFAFVPAYRNGAAPYGVFPWQACIILPAYINLPGYTVNGAARFDVGLCRMRNNSAGRPLSSTTGWLGLRYPGWPEHIHDIGYPARFRNGAVVPNAGLYTWLCAAETRFYTTDTLAWGCNLASGMSGAPVIYQYKPYVVSGWIESIHSGGFSTVNDAHGPLLRAHNIGWLCTNIGGC
jgi:V8-like Glu-specific endopeptidase